MRVNTLMKLTPAGTCHMAGVKGTIQSHKQIYAQRCLQVNTTRIEAQLLRRTLFCCTPEKAVSVCS